MELNEAIKIANAYLTGGKAVQTKVLNEALDVVVEAARKWHITEQMTQGLPMGMAGSPPPNWEDVDGDLTEIEEIALAREAGSGYRACRCHNDAPAPGAPVVCPMHGVKEGS